MAEHQSTEEWRPVVGFEGRYSVSNQGRVRSEWSCNRWPPRRMLGYHDGKGYRRVKLCHGHGVETFLIHRLVMEAFVGPAPADRPDVNHIDCNPSNNRVENLEYVSPLENMQHAKRMGRMHATRGSWKPGHKVRRRPDQILQRGEKHPDAKLTEAIVREIRATPIRHQD